jgi:serine/threonine-protein kinase RsbT
MTEPATGSMPLMGERDIMMCRQVVLRTGVRLAFEDKGPGIADVDLALTDGWTSGSGMGVGLSGSRRLVNDFELRTVPGVGTCVTVTRWK